MMKKAQTPYPECTEDDIVLVCEPAAEYGEPIVYQGTTITNALKDYYAFTTNHEKVDVLKWIVAQVKKGFEHNQNVKDFFIFKGSRLILISKKMAESKRFDINFKSLWNSNK